MALIARRGTASVVPVASQPPALRGADGLRAARRPHVEPFAKLPPVPVSETCRGDIWRCGLMYIVISVLLEKEMERRD